MAQKGIMTYPVILRDQEWYEITVLLKRGLEKIHQREQGAITEKWIYRYEHMIEEIENAMPND
jgi:hypothetical protein